MSKIFWVFALAAVLACARAEVTELDKSNFNSTVLGNQYVVTMYYDPFNNLSKKFLPKFERISKDITNVVFTKLNGEKEIEVADEQGIDDYPSFELFVWGVPIKYIEHDSVSALKQWIANKTNVTYTTASSNSEIGKKDFELYFSASTDSAIERIMQGIQKKHEDMRVVRLNSSLATSVAKSVGVTLPDSSNAIFVKRDHDKHGAVYSGAIEPFELEKWIVSNEYPAYSNFSNQSLVWLEKEELPVLFFLHDPSTTNSTWIENVKTAAPEIKGTALTVLADITKSNVKDFIKSNGFKNFPLLVVMEHDKPQRRYLCKKTLPNVTVKSITNCIHDYESKGLKRFYKSEEPVTELDRNTAYLTGNTFGKQVFSNFEKYHLVYFYNSTTTESFKNFASKVGALEKVSFGVYDLEKNEHRQTLHIVPGSLLFFSPDDDNIAEIKPENLTDAEILPFLEDKAPHEIFDAVSNAFKGIDL